MTETVDQKTYWNEVVGAKWVANQVRLDRLMQPLTEALLQVAVPEVGDHVLDVGCGCGDLSLRLAEAVGPGGGVLGVDVSRPMLAHAVHRSGTQGPRPRAPIEWLEADAMTHPFVPAHDLLTSRFGVMFFDDKGRAFANLRKALKPGGRFAFLAWRGRAEVEWFEMPLDWIAPVLPKPEPIDGAVGPCALADGEQTRVMLEEVGFRQVVAGPLDRTLAMGETVEDALALLLDTGPAAGLIREAEPDQRIAAEALLREGLLSHAQGGGRVELRGACWVYRGVL